MASDNFELTELAAGETEKTNRVNLTFQELEDAISETLTIAMADADAVLDTVDATAFNRSIHWTITSSPFTADRTLTIPARRKLFIVDNTDTSVFRLGLLPLAGNTSWLFAGQKALVYSDGTDAHILMSPSDWAAPALAGNWTNTGGSFNNLGVRQHPGSGLIELRGVVQNAVDTMPAGNTITTLPANYRPVADCQYTVPELGTAGNNATVQITAAGVVAMLGPGIIPSSGIALDGIILR